MAGPGHTCRTAPPHTHHAPLLLLVLLLLPLSSLSQPTTTMACTLRDFLPMGCNGLIKPGRDSCPAGGNGHPDFETYRGNGATRNMVRQTLPADGKPALACAGQPAGDDRNCPVSSSSSFDQWYRSVPGINKEVQTTMTLTWDPGRNYYSYENLNYFPLTDDPLGWNDKSAGENGVGAYNFFFTLECKSEFTYRGGEFYEFQGDDDLWIFINNRLVIDLGGVHGQVYGRTDLNSMGLTKGQTYPFKLFFAERHTHHSHFKVSTTLKSNPFHLWVPGPWPKCNCAGDRSRAVICVLSTAMAVAVAEANCAGAGAKPPTTQACVSPPTCFMWVPGPWPVCKCDGQQARTVICVHVLKPAVAVAETNCLAAPGAAKPATTQSCPIPISCSKWVPRVWSTCDCDGRRTRTAFCVAAGDPSMTPIGDSKCDPASKPLLIEACPAPPSCFIWVPGDWPPCDCDGGQRRVVVCLNKRNTAIVVADVNCDAATRPTDTQSCAVPRSCFEWVSKAWSSCPCTRVHSRTVQCHRTDPPHAVVVDAECDAATRPITREPCTLSDAVFEALCVPQPSVNLQSECLGGGAVALILIPMNATKSTSGLGGRRRTTKTLWQYARRRALSLPPSPSSGARVRLQSMTTAIVMAPAATATALARSRQHGSASALPLPQARERTNAHAHSILRRRTSLADPVVACIVNGQPPYAAVRRPGHSLIDGDMYTRHECVMPPYTPPTKSESGSSSDVFSSLGLLSEVRAGRVSWAVPLRLTIDAVPHSKTFIVHYRPCCTIPAAPPLWPLILLLPLALAACVCGVCAILVGGAQKPHSTTMLYADPPVRPKTPKVQLEMRIVEKTVQLPKPPSPKKPPPVVTKKKKWDTVATGQYLRNGAFVETNWGKHGEMGGEVIIDEDSSDSDSSNDGKDGNRLPVVLHETVEFEVEVPSAPDVQALQIVTPKGVVSPTAAAMNKSSVQTSGNCCPPLCPLCIVLISLLLFAGAIAGTVLLDMWFKAQVVAVIPQCMDNNASSFCRGVATCSPCDDAPLCEWCGSSCHPRQNTSESSFAPNSANGGLAAASAVASAAAPSARTSETAMCGGIAGAHRPKRVCPAEPMALSLLGGLAFTGFLIIMLVACAAYCCCRRRAVEKAAEEDDGAGESLEGATDTIARLLWMKSTGTGLTMDPFSFGGAKHANEDRIALSPKHDAEHTEAQFDEYAAGGIGIIANITRGLDDDDLPTGWAQVHDPESGHAYFYNENTGESTWDRPAGSLSE